MKDCDGLWRFQNVPERTRTYQSVPERTRAHHAPCFRTFQDALGRFEAFQYAPGRCFSMFTVWVGSGGEDLEARDSDWDALCFGVSQDARLLDKIV